MRYLFALLLLPLAVSSEAQDPFLSGEALSAAVQARCAEGCVLFSREDAARLEAELERILSLRMREAFSAGEQAQKAACASLI